MGKSSGSTRFLDRLNPLKSIGVRLFLVFFIATMGIVLSLGYTSYSVAKQTIENNALAANEQTVRQTADKLDVILLRYEDRLAELFYNKEIQSAVAGAKADDAQQRLTNGLSEWLGAGSGMQTVYLIPADATRSVAGAGKIDNAFMEGMRNSAWFKELLEKPKSLWITEALKVGDNSGVLHFAKSAAGPSGNIEYVAVGDVPAVDLEKNLSEVNLGMDSYVQLLTSKDELIASSLEDQADSYLRLGGTLFKGLQQQSGSLPTKDEQGKSILAVYGTLKSSGWRVLGVVPSENLIQDAQRILNTTYIAVGAAAVIAIIIGFGMVRMVSKPLSRLKALMSRGADGELSVRSKVVSKDEIGQLSGAFNTMMERISELVVHTSETARDVLDTADFLYSASAQTALASKDIATATEEIAGGAGSLALEVDRGNEITAHITGGMGQMIAAAGEMSGQAHEVGQASGNGVARLQRLLEQTESTGELTGNLAAKVNELRESVSSVMEVLAAMQNITQQTNILSLNASIEAARAGEAGRGFTVVANEIRLLSDQSKRSIAMASDITDLIMRDMHETVDALSAVTPLFREQLDSVQETSEIFITVQDRMDQFLGRLDEVGSTMRTLNESQQVLSETIANVSSFAEESSAASEEVASLTGEQQTVSEHLVEMSGKLKTASEQLKERLAKFSV
ncbi:methyl-accepting chemotaxis protein [Paenibacillus sp. NFR01]|nr:methyl-accepting chemotaxis protein [Paenibacillus sp. NFR01]